MADQTSEVYGFGSAASRLSLFDVRNILEHSLAGIGSGVRVLAVVPDKTRDDNTNNLFPLAADILAARHIVKLDILVAQGTHAPMNAADKFAKIGIASTDDLPLPCNIYDHEWDNPSELISIGELSSERVVNRNQKTQVAQKI